MVQKLPACRAAAPSSAPWWALRANWLYTALASGELKDHDGNVEKARLPVRLDSVGSLSFEDGRLVVADPYLMDEEPAPIVQELLSRPYDVMAATVEVGPDHPRIAAAMLVSGIDAIVAWEMAHWPGQDPASLGSEEFVGYGVDAGTGCFASPAAAKVAGRVLAADGGMLEDPISRALFSGPPAAGAAVIAPEEGAPPVAVFSSGWGDGLYPTWLGLNQHGDVAVAITDFLLTRDPYATPEETPEVTPQAPHAPKWKHWFRKRR
jgi:hypothetical protein